MFNINLTNKDSTSKNAKTVVEILPIIGNDVSKDGYFKVEVDSSTHNIFISNISNVGRGINLVIPYSYTSYSVVLPKKNGTIALTSDIEGKQSTLYRHTIEITKDNEATLILTTESTISTEINTMDKFISAFTGSELACMCALSDANAWNIHYIGIQVGTTLNDTSMMSTNVLDTGMTFTDVFGTSGYTMVDKVKPL